MKLIIIFVLGMAVAAYFLFFDNKKPKKDKNGKKTTQEFINVIDISPEGIIETRDGYYIGTLMVSGRKTDLLSRREQQGLIDQQTAEVSTLASGWQILAVSQPEDNAAIVSQYSELLDNTQNMIQKKLLREAIRFQNKLVLDGENMERQFYIKLWEVKRDGAEQELGSRLNQFAKCFDVSGYTCERANREEVIRLCNMIHNPTALLYEADDIEYGMPWIIY